MPEKIYNNENYYNDDKYSRSGEFIENMVTDNVLEFSHRYFHLASFEEFLFEDLPEFLDMGYGRQPIYNNGIFFLPPNANIVKRDAINFNYRNNALRFYDVEPLDFKAHREILRQKAGI